MFLFTHLTVEVPVFISLFITYVQIICYEVTVWVPLGPWSCSWEIGGSIARFRMVHVAKKVFVIGWCKYGSRHVATATAVR